jgi:tRNA(Ile)-lysidine synthetase-like protein
MPAPEPPSPPALRRHRLPARLDAALRRLLRDRLPGGGRAPAVVAVSGGADSVALLLGMDAIARRRRDPAPPPVVAHVHHHLRGADADADARFVAELAESLGLEHHRRDVHPGGDLAGVAARARDLRLEALREVAEQTGRRLVLTAHHAEDQLETVLMRLARGVDPSRLGMPAVRPIAAGSPVLLVRPLLEVRRDRLIDACRVAGVPWREDATNHDPDRRRIRLRTAVLPVLEQIAPGAAARVAAAVERCEPGPPAVTGPGQDALPVLLDRGPLAAMPEPDRAAAIRLRTLAAAPHLADRLTRAAVLEVARACGDGIDRPRRWHWPAGIEARLDVRRLRIDRRGPGSPTTEESPLIPKRPARFPDPSR